MAEYHDRRGHQRGMKDGRNRGMGFRRLNELSLQDGKQLLNIVSNSQSGFAELLKSNNLKPDWIDLILSISTKVCDYTHEPLTAHSGLYAAGGKVDNSRVPSALLLTYLNQVRTSNFLMQGLLPFISAFLTEIDIRRRRRFSQIMKDIMVLCNTILVAMPTNVVQVFPVLSTIDMVVRNMRMTNTLQDDDTMATQLREVLELCNEVMADQSRHVGDQGENQAHRNIPRQHVEREPPNNFRELSIFPTADDLLMRKEFIPFNKVSGKYADVERYLDTHFRLLREDFMRPLRNGITQYLDVARKPGERHRLQNIRIYQDVHIIYPVCTSDGIAYRVSFDVARIHGVRWENTKRLIYGALVCLSPDSFTTVYFATVSHRDAEQLGQGIVELRFQGATEEVNQIGIHQKLVMAESSAYFEAYRHVLLGLKAMHEENLPFSQYLVNCNKQVEKPQYLPEGQDIKYDLHQLIATVTPTEEQQVVFDAEEQVPENHIPFDTKHTTMLRQIPILRHRAWPSADTLNLDESQLEALQCALSRELAIIQGPPGTGKTYIGLRIVRALLQNTQHWKDGDSNPVLLICYTNHALDQFLEGISRFLHHGIVRVGGRSKSEVLERFMLRELRKGMRERKDIPVDVHRNRMDAMDEMDRLRLTIQKNIADIEASTKGLMRESELEDYMRERHYTQLMDGATIGKHKSNFSNWLGLDDGSALTLYEEIIEEEEEPMGIMNSDTEGHSDIENEPDDEVDKLEEQRIIHGLDDVKTREENFRQKRIMDMALEKLSLKFSELNFRLKHQRGKSDPRRQKTEQNKIKCLLERSDVMSADDTKLINNIWELYLVDRWRLYRKWLESYRESINKDLRALEAEYELAARRLCEVKQQEDLEIMRKATILGMTTTGAAKYREVLHQIQPKLIIVEEAAEVLEAHILTSLTPGCQHLVLIGDHKQLRPKPTDYKLAEVHKLKVSMFERLVTNGLPYVTLELQHRMPPNISRLLHHVYSNLKDHQSVLNFEAVNGIETNVFFIDHDKEETQNEDLQSKTNKHEANYIVALCRHLVLQGYKPTQITILTPYTGQLSIIRTRLRTKNLHNVRACAIDNFQGEENDIILVSLVRSNQEAKIGFLGENNRICVALSRAKKAMYLIGNAAILGQMNELWSKVIQTMHTSKQIGRYLTLCCRNHPKSAIHAENAEDFGKSPEGGCLEPCQVRLKCGHVCPRVCHAYDTEHQEHRCRKKCARVCAQQHPCKNMCFEECGQCQIVERRRMPNCGHIQHIPCYEHPATYKCQAQCTFKLQCDHPCQNKCGEPHTSICKLASEKRLLCGHGAILKCSEKADSALCKKKCTTPLHCMHECRGTCGECDEGRLHNPCQSPCNRSLVCGHLCDAPCTRNCPPCSAKCENRCPHSICQELCGRPCIPCIEPCAWRCVHHQCNQRCCDPCDRPSCDQPCTEKLPCGHDCIGLCGEPCPRKCRICNKDEIQTIFFGTEDEDDARFVELEDCGHVLEVTGLDEWMNAAVDMSDGKVNVKLKVCPQCSKPIRQNLRYGKIIKTVLSTIEDVKAKVFGRQRQGHALIMELQASLARLEALDRPGMTLIEDRLRERDDQIITEEEATCIENSINFLCKLMKLSSEIKERLCNISDHILKTRHKRLVKDLAYFKSWALKTRNRMGEQELEEAQKELSRMNLMAISIEYQLQIQEQRKPLPVVVDQNFQRAFHLLERTTPLADHDEGYVKDALKEVDKIVPRSGLRISEDERVQIVKAMGLQQGHWFKCRNGETYIIYLKNACLQCIIAPIYNLTL